MTPGLRYNRTESDITFCFAVTQDPWRRKKLSVPPLPLIADPHHDLPFGSAVLQRCNGRAGLIQWVDLRLRRSQPTGAEQLFEGGPLLGKRAGVCPGPGAPANTDDVNIVEQQPVYLHGGNFAARE